MRRGVDGSSAAEQSPSPTAIKRKGSRHLEHHGRKKGKLIISGPEIENETETLTLIPSGSSTSTFSSRTYRHTHKISYTDSHHAHKKRHRKRKKLKLAFEDEHRQWNNSTRDLSSYSERVVFVSYNVLGVENASKHPDLYRKASPKYMDWDYRKHLLRKEIKDYKAGIMCLQEVDRFDDLDNLLRKDGFRGVYKARTSDVCDGCAIFWKDKQFSLLHEESIEFQSYGLRNNVAQLCVFKVKILAELCCWQYTCTLQPKSWRHQARSDATVSGESPKIIRRLGKHTSCSCWRPEQVRSTSFWLLLSWISSYMIENNYLARFVLQSIQSFNLGLAMQQGFSCQESL